MKKTMLLTGILALSAISIAYAKSFDVNLSHATQVGNVELKAGEYELKMDGDKAIFTDVDTSKKFVIPAKIETVTKKFDYTTTEELTNGNVDVLKAIHLGGTTTQVDF